MHSQTGTMANSEKPVAEAVQLAVDEINAKGGVLGRKIEIVTADGASTDDTFAREADRLIRTEKVCSVFGCWTSASRKTVLPIFEKNHHLLFYPVQYEGLEQSPNIVYLGAAPNQQIIPAVTWGYSQLGKRFFLIGSDYVFPRTANAIIRDQALALGAEVVGEEYLPLGSRDLGQTLERIQKSKPDLIFNTINGDSNQALFKALQGRNIPVISFSLAEAELQSMDPELTAGHFAAWNYFQSLSGPRNRQFVEAFRNKYGQNRVTDDPIEAAYCGVYLWAQAVQEAGSDEVSAIRRCIRRQSLAAPEGTIYIDPDTQHSFRSVNIGRIRKDGQFDVMWSSGQPIRPVPFPIYRSRADWLKFLDDLYRGWGDHWSAPQ
ncbi:urea ABC transporter substrate-binding protein [bacterium SCN 62-11]|nr:MAG: urea ABC transporter substrate-binding protein [bacterium SCN 62-11]